MTTDKETPALTEPLLDIKAQVRLEKYMVELMRSGDAVHATDIQSALREVKRLRALLG